MRIYADNKISLIPYVLLNDGSVYNVKSACGDIKTVCEFEDVVKHSIKKGYVEVECTDKNQLCKFIPISTVKEFSFNIEKLKDVC